MACADLPEAPGRGHDLLVSHLLHSQLNEINPAAERGLQEVICLRIADQIQAGGREAVAYVLHAPSLA